MLTIALHFFLGLIASVIGALPLGLVNLSVIQSTLRDGSRKAFQVSTGATVIEVIYVLAGIYLGQRLSAFIEAHEWVSYAIFFVLLTASLFFFLKRKTRSASPRYKFPAVLKGMILNLLSFQVLIYWLVAIAFLQATVGIEFTAPCIIAFTLAVFLGKMLTLYFFSIGALRISQKASIVSRKIDTIIGAILAVLAIIQLIRTVLSG